MNGLPSFGATYANWPTVYLTTEQLQRLAALSLDALSGVQFRTDASDMTAVQYSFVHIDDPNSLRHGVVFTDGRWTDET